MHRDGRLKNRFCGRALLHRIAIFFSADSHPYLQPDKTAAVRLLPVDDIYANGQRDNASSRHRGVYPQASTDKHATETKTVNLLKVWGFRDMRVSPLLDSETR